MYLTRALSAALTSGIISPLYIYPGDAPACAAWTPLINSITANPDLPFYVIVNPGSGPGPDPLPDTNYQGCIPLLKNSNVQVLGYVPTTGGSRAQSAVTADVDTYAGWGSAFRPNGIFFDEVSGQTAQLSLYTQYASHAEQVFNSGQGFVTLNPGVNPSDPSYFNIADLLVTHEVYYSDFSLSLVSISPSTPAAKQGIILHDSPSTPPTSLINQLVGTDHIGAIYITDDTQANNGNPYDSFPTDWDAFVNAVAAAQ